MQIDGGNWQIFDGMLKASNATVHLNNTVNSISKHKGKFSVKTKSEDAITRELSTNEALFDTIVLAAPLQYSGIEIEDGLLEHTPDEIPYVSLHVTLFTSSRKLDRGFFNLSPNAEVPTSILTTLQPDQVPSDPEKGCGKPGFFSISTLRTVINPHTLEKENLYKVFSPQALSSEFLSGILGIPSKLTFAQHFPSKLTNSSPHKPQQHNPHKRRRNNLVLPTRLALLSIRIAPHHLRRLCISSQFLLHEWNGELHFHDGDDGTDGDECRAVDCG